MAIFPFSPHPPYSHVILYQWVRNQDKLQSAQHAPKLAENTGWKWKQKRMREKENQSDTQWEKCRRTFVMKAHAFSSAFFPFSPEGIHSQQQLLLELMIALRLFLSFTQRPCRHCRSYFVIVCIHTTPYRISLHFKVQSAPVKPTNHHKFYSTCLNFQYTAQ